MEVCRLQRTKVPPDAGFHLLYPPFELAPSEVAVARVDTFELGAVDGGAA